MEPRSEPVGRSATGRRTGVSAQAVLAGVLLVAGLLLLWSALTAEGDFGLRGPRLAPVVVTVAWVAVAGVYLVTQLRPRQRPMPDVAGETTVDATEATDQEQHKPGWWAPAGVLAALVGFAVALEYAGFVVSAALFTVATARVLGSRNLVRDVIVAVVLPIAVYLGFTRFLDIFLPAGVFPL
ncbi:tripartite tricarboxylate transporter TctB family protein [Actinoplanes sp. NPDC051346]|uniref:tripartite tricarboxylate transporter TctB family protein n=1 Tax=Actinoplanes sp. NPDC051346 TaxID=3155048 RepID=UPI00341C5878